MAQPSGSAVPPGRRFVANATPSIDTTGASNTNNRYSFTETPMEMHLRDRPTFNHPSTSPTNSTIDESPITPASLSSRVLPIYTEPARNALVPQEKNAYAQQHSPHQVHPAYFAPYREDSQRQQPQEQLHSSTPGIPPVSITAATPMSPTSYPNSPLEPHTNANSDVNALKPQGIKLQEPRTASTIVPDTYDPSSLQGPNVGPENHRPGQVSHPNANMDPHWRHGLCEPSALCCIGIVCPCVIYGKTQYRLNRKSQRDDPSNLLGYESCNGACGLFALACGFQWILAAIQRTRIRKAYDIDGDVATDCVKACCCCCFVVAQGEREVKEREDAMRRHAGPSSGAYISPGGGMSYAPPPR